MKNKCDIKDLISPLIDGELSPQKKESVRLHLTVCAICRKEYDMLNAVGNLLLDVKPVEPSDDFAREFWKKVDGIENKKSQWSFFENYSWGWRPVLGAVAVLLTITAGAGIFHRSVPPGFDPTVMLIAENIALYSDYEIVNNLELFENWEEIVDREEKLN